VKEADPETLSGAAFVIAAGDMFLDVERVGSFGSGGSREKPRARSTDAFMHLIAQEVESSQSLDRVVLVRRLTPE